ncbi:MAG TPA: TonB-dependent receptor [Terriglobales bacterium]|jgi:hypothetical protein|nr:TonB-dependent receptor [Terriglobales bacterium]
MKSHMAWTPIGLVLVLVLSVTAFAQDTGQITGTVKDPSGASIANAQVSISSPERGIDRLTNTNTAGDYLVGGLPPGSYNLSITAPGFKTFQASGIILRVGQKTRADASLEVGSVTTEVTVEGTGIGNVETQSSDLAGTVTGKQITQLELNGRVFTQLATLVPGVSNQSGQDEGTVGINGNVAFSFNGGRTEYNNWELDGGDNMDNGSNTTLNVYPSLDAIAEFRVLTSNYGAQYGRNGSGTVEVETKSGTTSFHGTAYEFVRNDLFNARNYFESEVPAYKKNDFGYTLGGPLYIPGVFNTKKDKTFFFWSQEWRRDRVPGQVFNTPVPSVAERSGDFSDLCPNQVTGSMEDCPIDSSGNYMTSVPVDPVGQALLALIPPPNAGVPGAEYYNASPNQPTNWREELIRVDHNFSSKLRGMFRYTHDSWSTVTATTLWTGSSFPTVQTNFSGPALSLVARLTANPSPTLLNEFTFSYTTDHIFMGSTGFPDSNAWKRPADLPMGFLFNNGFGGKLPAISLAGGAAYGGGFYEDPNSEWPEGKYNANPTYTYRDNVTKILGRHNLQFGAYLATAQKNELSSAMVSGSLSFDTSSAVTTGNPFADLLMGRVASFQQGSNQLKYYYRYKILEPYLQDDWRITNRLTLNLGLRVSLFGLYGEKYSHGYNWDPAAYNPALAPQIDADGSITGFAGALIPGSGNPFDGLVQCGVNGTPVGCMKGHLFNPAPRIGFAWDPRGDGKTAIRAGYGIFWEHTNGNEANIEGMMCCGQSSPLVKTATQYNISTYSGIGGGGTVEFPYSFMSVTTQATWPYVQQWHLDVQREVAHNTVATISYVGSKGTHLNRQLDLNQLLPVSNALNPYKLGEPISPDTTTLSNGATGSVDCGFAVDSRGVPLNAMTPSGVPITGQAAVNLAVAACGAIPDLFRPYSGIGTITRLENMASSIYHSFQASIRRNVGALQLNAAYTYSHSIDDASSRYDAGFINSYNPGASRASSNFDIRHMLNIGYVYDLPFFKEQGWKNKLLGGWQISGITSWMTGTPFSVSNSGNYPDNAGVANAVSANNGSPTSFPDVIGDPNSSVPSGRLPGFGPLVANPNVFVAPRGLTFGNAGRNSLRNPHRTDFDMALFKRFAITESKAFEFRAEAFNVFNHTQWGTISGDGGSASYNGGPSSGTNGFGSDNFLRIAAAHSARILQLGLKFVF